MSSKDKDSKSFQDKLKDLFKRNKGQPGNTIGGQEFVITDARLRDISKESPLPTRLRVLKELCEVVSNNKLECNGVEKLWNSIEDLFDREYSNETRHFAFNFLQCLIKGQIDRIKIMRAQFFRFIKNHDIADDVGDRLELLIILTNNGKFILYFEEEVGKFLLKWFPDILGAGKILDYLSMIDNVIKFNAAYLDYDVTSGFIENICKLCCNTNTDNIVKACLTIMSSIVAYSVMSPESLPKFIGALCRTVVIESYSISSWEIMKNLLGTHMGHAALYTMCKILQEPKLRTEIPLFHGAVFYIHMALWSDQLRTPLHCPPSSVLPSFLSAVQSNHPAVMYEVISGIKQLVIRRSLEDPAWSILFEILSHIIKQIPNQNPNPLIVATVHETLNKIEDLHERNNFNGSVKQFFSIIEECSNDRPEVSVLKLISHLSENIVPTEYMWLTNLSNLMTKYFKQEHRTNIRLEVLKVLSNVIELNRLQYEDEIIDCIIIPTLINISSDSDVVVRSSVAKLLLDICIDCESKKCLDVLEILEKLLKRPFDYQSDSPLSEPDCLDIKCLVNGLINVFIYKIHKLPSSHAIKIYHMLVGFLEMHYVKPKLFENCNPIRSAIFDCFLKMRADNLYHLGYPDAKNVMKYSSYLCVTYPSRDRGPLGSPPPQSPAISQQIPCTVTHVSLRPAFKIFITCLKLERDWDVLNLVLQGMSKVLQNKSLILSKQGNNELHLLVEILCSMISDKSMNLPESLSVKVNKVDFQSAVIIVLVGLASYHSYLDSTQQLKMIVCLTKCCQTGPRCAKHCISALTICTLEMSDVMVKMLPEVLLILSKISATVYIAIPVLEFLSILTQLPMVFANFVADQYMAVFAISLPYTNLFKYDHYIVSLAHHVIAVWFLKCRLPFRKDFVKFITNGLQTNVLYEESTINKADLTNLNEDSSDRKRSSSFTEQSTRRKAISSVQFRPQVDKTLTLYKELMETCIDLMARYAFSPCSALPRRLPTAEFLLNGGQSMCWLIGNKLVTVTTSGCSQKVLKNGLCDKCLVLCSRQNECKAKLTRSNATTSENPDNAWVTRQNSNEKSNNTTSASSPMDETKKLGDKLETLSTKLQQVVGSENRNEKPICACFCQGWAEIYIRRPTGDMSWVMRIQNQISYQHAMYDFPINEISTIYMPSLVPSSGAKFLCRQSTSEETEKAEEETRGPSIPGSPNKMSPSRQNSVDEELDYIYDDGTKSRNPVRRSNSSPEMSANWKNPFMQKQEREGDNDKSQDDDQVKKNKMYSKDMRVSCEAIPEEMAGSGTTPPSIDPFQQSKQSLNSTVQHPSLLSCHSYPGSSPPADSSIKSKPYQTVPPSPNVVGAVVQPDFSKGMDVKKRSSMDSVHSERPTNLPTLSSLVPLSSKPPQSPTQTSPRLSRHSLGKDKEGHDLQKSSSSSIIERNTSNMNLSLAREKARDRKNSGNLERLNSQDMNQGPKRERGHTISVMNSARKPRSDQIRQPGTRSKEAPKSGINPSFVFLQLYHAPHYGNDSERPLLVGSSDKIQRAVKILDGIPPYETHKIGVIYIKEGQINNEVEILRNRFGSLRYVEFLKNLGTLVKLSDVDPQVFFLGGLDQNGSDGNFAYIWQDDVVRVMFHVATMMPYKETDPNCTNKKLHIGNNYVTIVYNESGEEFNINTITGQFNFAAIVIQPLDHNTNRVTVKIKNKLSKLIDVGEPKIISNQNVAILAKQLALHANLASLVETSERERYASNWLERLRKIKDIRNKIKQEIRNEDNAYPSDDSNKKKQMEDFTDYT